MVVIRIGESQGLRWEIDMVTDSLKANRLLLQVPRLASRNEAVLVDRVVRRITGRNQDYDYNDVKYIYFDDRLIPRFIKGPLVIPKRSPTDAHNVQLRGLYRQMFSNEIDNYWERQEREEGDKRNTERRGRKIRLAILLSILGFLIIMIVLCAGIGFFGR